MRAKMDMKSTAHMNTLGTHDVFEKAVLSHSCPKKTNPQIKAVK